jgi:hypothetical protein
MTDLVNYLIQIENDGYTLIQSLCRDALTIPGGGWAHWWYEPTERVEYETYTYLDPAQAAFIRADPEVEVAQGRDPRRVRRCGSWAADARPRTTSTCSRKPTTRCRRPVPLCFLAKRP